MPQIRGAVSKWRHVGHTSDYDQQTFTPDFYISFFLLLFLTSFNIIHKRQDTYWISPSLSFFLVGWDLRHQVLRPLLAYCTAPYDRWGWLWSNWWNENWQGKPKYSEKTCPSAILSTTNSTWPDPCANTGRPTKASNCNYHDTTTLSG
jgi:hypothetical protein